MIGIFGMTERKNGPTDRPSWIAIAFVGLTQLSARIRAPLWRWWYNRMVAKDQTGHWLLMNYGFAGDDAKSPLALRPEDEPFRYPLQLYNHVVNGIDLAGKDILEVGCGRGGGGAYLARSRNLRSYTGVDLSEVAIDWCRQRFQNPTMHWLAGKADALPLPDASVDVVINVESSHCYPSMSRFLVEVRRVLRPGGYFAFCDMRTADGISDLDACVVDSGLHVVERQEITPNVLRALELVSEQREREITSHVPRLLRRAFRDFAGVKNSAVYDMLKQGRMVYVSYVATNGQARRNSDRRELETSVR